MLGGDFKVMWCAEAESTLEVRFPAYVDASCLAKVIREVRALVGARQLDGALLDASRVERYSADVRGPSRELLDFLRQHGVRRPIAVSSRGAVRMIGSAIALAVGIPIVFVETRSGAVAKLGGGE
jgi:hypothetical protein